MKRLFLVTCLVAFALMAAAGAQDNTNFSGFYVGANVGGAFGTADARVTTVEGSYFASTSPAAIAIAGRQELKPTGITGGVTGGYNWRNEDGFFLGLEMDFGAMRLDDSALSSAEYPCCPGETFTVGQQVQTSWLFTLRPRMGYTKNNWLLYLTGGLTATNIEYHADFIDTFGATESASFDDPKLGWTVGGGMEFQIPDTHWSLKGEYLFLRFDDVSKTSLNLTDGVTIFADTPFEHTTDLKAHVVRFGVNYRF